MSSGQLSREPRNFPAMKYRAARRHEQAAFGGHRSRRRPGYACGGLIQLAAPRRITLAVDQCILHPGDHWRCARTDEAHLATEDHRIWAALPLLPNLNQGDQPS